MMMMATTIFGNFLHSNHRVEEGSGGNLPKLDPQPTPTGQVLLRKNYIVPSAQHLLAAVVAVAVVTHRHAATAAAAETALQPLRESVVAGVVVSPHNKTLFLVIPLHGLVGGVSNIHLPPELAQLAKLALTMARVFAPVVTVHNHLI